MYSVYILRNHQNKLYIGQTSDVSKRLKAHQSKQGANFTKQNYPSFGLVYKESFKTLTKAVAREKQLKGWTRAKKEALIKGDLELLKEL